MNNPYLVLPERSVQQLFSKSAIGTETQLVSEMLCRIWAAMKAPGDVAHL
jgi:hypothetical protein